MIISSEMVPFCGRVEGGIHRLSARVYYADTDLTGVVYNGRYFEFLERGFAEFLRIADVHHHELADGQYGEVLAWAIRRMTIDFAAPARLDDIIVIETGVKSVSGARIHMKQRIMRDGRLLIDAIVEAALINDKGNPRRFPKEWIKRFLSPQPNLS